MPPQCAMRFELRAPTHAMGRTIFASDANNHYLTDQRAENGGLDPLSLWLNLAVLGRPDLQSRGPKILVLKGFETSGWKIGAPPKRQIQPRRIQPPILGPLNRRRVAILSQKAPVKIVRSGQHQGMLCKIKRIKMPEVRTLAAVWPATRLLAMRNS